MARDALRALVGLRRRRRCMLALKLAGSSYREIMELLGVTWFEHSLAAGACSVCGRPYS